MLSVVEDFEGAGEVKKVHVVMHGHEHLDRLIDILPNCTHFDGCLG